MKNCSVPVFGTSTYMDSLSKNLSLKEAGEILKNRVALRDNLRFFMGKFCRSLEEESSPKKDKPNHGK
jgi:hypothetical protein